MTPPTDVAVVSVPRVRRRALVDFVALTKPRIVVMILVTTLVGYYVGLTGAADYARLVHLLVGTLMAAGGALALNQYWERDIDALMKRTRGRPLPDGRLQPTDALVFAVAFALLGVVYLLVLVNPLAAAVTAATIVLYVFAYTPLKVRTPLCTLVGAVSGALPPVTGWVAARNDLGIGAWALFGILFLWQLPHTLAIGRLYRDDYARAGVRVLPVVDGLGGRTERQITLACVALFAVSLVPALVGVAGVVYLAGAGVFGFAFLGFGVASTRARSLAAARRVLLASVLYLPALLALLAFDKL